MRQKLNLLIINDNYLYQFNKDYFSIYSWIRFAEHIANYCDKVIVYAPIIVLDSGESINPDCWKIKSNNLQIEPFDYYDSFKEYYQLYLKKRKTWQHDWERIVKKCEAVIIRVPSPRLGLITKLAISAGKPLIMLVSGNIISQSDKIRKNKGLTRLIYSIIANLYVYQEIKSAKYADLIFAYNTTLLNRFKTYRNKVKLFRTPHLSENDIFYRSDTCNSSEIRLLRVCWLIPSKGLENLLKAVALLRRRGWPVRLEIVGKERSLGYQNDLERLATDLGIRDYVDFTGWVRFDQIFEVYLRNDLHIISSVAEGTPRSLLEGAIYGLPLISTAIAGCADTLIHEKNALLVPPDDAEALTAAVTRVIQDERLRKNLILNGYNMARKYTFENLGIGFLQDIKNVVLSKNNQ